MTFIPRPTDPLFHVHSYMSNKRCHELTNGGLAPAVKVIDAALAHCSAPKTMAHPKPWWIPFELGTTIVKAHRSVEEHSEADWFLRDLVSRLDRMWWDCYEPCDK